MGIKKRLDDVRWLLEQVRPGIENRFTAALADVELVAFYRGILARRRAEVRYRASMKLEVPRYISDALLKEKASLKAARGRVTQALADGIISSHHVWWLRTRVRKPEAVPA